MGSSGWPKRYGFKTRVYIGPEGLVIRLCSEKNGRRWRLSLESESGISSKLFDTLEEAESWLKRKKISKTLVVER